MKTDNWEKLENIFHTAISLPCGERSSFLKRECDGNGDLLAEVESLIDNFESEPEFLNEPVFELGLGAIHQSSQKNLAGTTIGFYELQEKIGAGGMGEVYKAFDTLLNRYVALKFISESLKNDTAAKRQLVKEAQAAAALEHPNICAVYGFEQTDEHHFIVMQYVEGQTLAEISDQKVISIEEFKSLARQILTAIAFAHSHGVIHRDIKTGNIMLTADGQIKVLDFGLAKIDSQKLPPENYKTDEVSRFSQNGLIIGTVSYMSPEQLRGEKLDYRSDIFSIGIILYKLITGKNPFNRQSQAETIAAILRENPATLTSLKERVPDFPEGLLKLVEKCLQKDKDARFQSAAEILVELDQTELEKNDKIKPKQFTGFFLKTALAAIFLSMILAVFFFYNSGKSRKTLMVLPISIESGVSSEKEYLAVGLTQSIIEKLAKLSDLKVKSESLVERYRKETVDPLSAGRESNVDAVFAATIQVRGNDLILDSSIIRTSDGFVIDNNKTKIEESNLVELPENLSQLIISKIKLNLNDDDRNGLAKKDTTNEEAKQSYYYGRFYLNRKSSGDIKEAILKFTKATDLDPLYAKAWAGLADAYIASSLPGAENPNPPAKAAEFAKFAAKKALDLDNSLSESYCSLGMISSKYDWNWVDAENYFRKAIEQDPEFIPARIGLIGVLTTEARFDESLTEAQKVKELDPLSLVSDLEMAKVYYRKRDYSQMDKIITNLLDRYPNNTRIDYTRSYLLLKKGQFDLAIEILEKIYKSGKEADKVLASAPLGFAYAKKGRREEALKIIDNLELFAKNGYVPAQEKAVIYVGLGDFDKALEYLNKSCREKFQTLPAFVTDPLVEEITTTASFEPIRKCVNL